MLKVAVLVSGGGTNLQALLDSEARGENPHGKISLVVASKPGVYALERAKNAGVPGVVVRRKDYATAEEFDKALLGVLKENGIDVVVLAGFLSILGESVIAAYPERILNVHPSLIPSAGVHVQNALGVGGDDALAQKAVEVAEGDTPETLQRRVMEQAEWQLLPAALAKVCAEYDKG